MNKIKSKIIAFTTIAALVLATINLNAQTTGTNGATIASETPPANFFQSVQGYFTSNDTNNSWKGNKLEIEAGADYINNVQWANYLRGGYNLNDNWQIDMEMRNAGIAGTVESVGGGVGYTLINAYSIKVEAYANLGYNQQYDSGFGEPGIAFKKKLTSNTYATLGMTEPIYFRNRGNIPNKWTPNIRVGAGFTY